MEQIITYTGLVSVQCVKVKEEVKFTLEQATKAQRGSRGIVLRHAPAALPLGKGAGTHCIGGRVGLRTSLDGCEKSRPPPGFDPRTVQPVANRYTGP